MHVTRRSALRLCSATVLSSIAGCLSAGNGLGEQCTAAKHESDVELSEDFSWPTTGYDLGSTATDVSASLSVLV
ncbi:hypothetical protein C440_13224 [Haloferax mucosum ATCC BAA-1512]|uniref:Uncharacterized protein n=1 Tax=Haloferax mucosum ATCC BAA-1512 TaxID=662479 RepID=M0I5N2_9EURY|nr:hypothetical protein [Haloferax mucosum]ELZ91277.1 hypothetical protein C440_13224 [Haloferax mucosum ATCC BAA-1512]